MKNKKNNKIWLILSSISALTAILPLAAISCDHKVKQNSKENKEDDSSNLNKTFKFELTKSNTWKIAKFIGNDSKVIIPKEYQGKNITEIGNRAFFNSVIQSVTIPGSIKK
ncbi:hypothetical protein [Metamycoplasma hominis]|nr:hypothetical protein [Metamycoplasma hominis]